MMRLEPKELQERAEEGARRQPEHALEVREEDHTLRALGLRPLLAPWQAHGDLRFPRQEPGGAEVGDVIGGDGRAHP